MINQTLEALFLGVVEGVTEFLPISSTAHMILLGNFLEFTKTSSVFEVVVQLSALFAILLIYFDRLFGVAKGALCLEKTSWRFIRNLVVAFLPFGVIGFLAHRIVLDYLLHNGVISASAMLIGGVILLWVDRSPRFNGTHEHLKDEQDFQDELTGLTAFKSLCIGFFQVLAIVPGVSRSGASIVGGMWVGLSKKSSAEFSFFLAIPTMLGATTLALWSEKENLTQENLSYLLFGSIASFISAYLVVKFFMFLIDKVGFSAFGWYRIIFGIVALSYMAVTAYV